MQQFVFSKRNGMHARSTKHGKATESTWPFCIPIHTYIHRSLQARNCMYADTHYRGWLVIVLFWTLYVETTSEHTASF